jgi:hypothetical protein
MSGIDLWIGSSIILGMRLRSPYQGYSSVEHRRSSLSIDFPRIRSIGQHSGELSVKLLFRLEVKLFLLGAFDKYDILFFIIIIVVNPCLMSVL